MVRWAGSVSTGEVAEAEMARKPALLMVGPPAVHSLEQVDPITATMVLSAASFAAAAWPPSGPQPES